MKVFLDTANVQSIKKWVSTGIIDGVTTNPTLLAKEGDAPAAALNEISSLLGDKDLSIEVTETAPEAVYEQAKRIARWGKNIVVKIPCKIEYLFVIKRLVKEGVALNITLVFSLPQSLYMAKLGVRYISPFIGRLDDISEDGMTLIWDIRAMLDHYKFSTQLLAASIRHLDHVREVIQSGADVITLPEKLLEESFFHQLTDKGIEKFMADWEKLGIREFP